MGPPDEEEPDVWGVRSKGFWKHQFRTATGEPGRQHVNTSDLEQYIDDIAANSTVCELQDIETLLDALEFLALENSGDMYNKAVQQLLAVWLNYYHNGDLDVLDTDDDNILDLNLSAAITEIEDILTNPASTKDDLEYAKDLADKINNSKINNIP
jgi:hypothetical protein